MGRPIPFRRSELLTLGVEWELQLLDQRTFDLSDRIFPLLEAFPDAHHVKPEFIQSCVEINSEVCRHADELYDHLEQVVRQLKRCAEKLGLLLCGGGTHPFCRRLALITPIPRYLQQKKRYGLLARSQITFATHVHLGMPEGETTIFLMERMRRYLPIIIGLSAASPFWRGYETGFASYRLRILASGRSYGLPPHFRTWEEFCHFFEIAKKAHLFESFRDPHWDLRPHPDFGTLEVRVMDAQLSLSDVVALAAFLQTLARLLLEEDGEVAVTNPLSWWLEKENVFQASRLGLQANAVAPDGSVYRLRDLSAQLLERLFRRADPVQRRWLERVGRWIEEGAAWFRLRQVWRAKGDLREVARYGVESLLR